MCPLAILLLVSTVAISVRFDAETIGIPPPSALAASAVESFSPNVRITDGTTPFPQHVEPSLAVDARGNLYAGWKEAITADGPGQRVAFARSEDGGSTWSANALMPTITAGNLASDPWLLLAPAGPLHYARLEYTPDGSQGGLAISRSDDGGRTWSALADPDDRPGFADKESLAHDGNGSLYVAYDDVLGSSQDQGDQVDLRVARSADGGSTWSSTVSVADGIGDILGPVLAASPNGTVHAVWWNLTDGNIRADRSRDHGLTWGTDVRVNPLSGSARYVNTSWAGSMPSVGMDAVGRLYVAWGDRGGGDLDVLVARSDDEGATWSAPVRVNNDTSGDQWMPALSVDGRGVLHVAWMDGRTGRWSVYHAASDDGGRTWAANVRVTSAETPSSFVRPGDYLGLATDTNGTAYVAWTDGRSGALNIYFAHSVSPAPEGPSGPSPFPWATLFAVGLGAAVGVAVLAYVVLRRRRVPPEPS